MQPETEKRLDSIIFETTAKMEAIVQEMKAIKFSNLDDVSKHEKTDRLRKEFEVILNEQKIRVEEIMKDEEVK
ncbi:MAG: hypothetical protein IH842_01200 [Thaumarchaeota archaeon]|nr:hypothetical protein [Nitrososphaerota archaeon]